MMCVWSHRPHFLHMGLFIAAYVLGCGFAQLLAIVPGTGISIWPPSGLFMATLILVSRLSWPWWVLAGLSAELFGNVLWFHSPLPAAVLIYAGNALEAMTGAWLVTRFCEQPVRLENLREVLALVVLGAGVAPIVSATVGSATLAGFGILSQTFWGAWPLFWIGDATGVLIVAPLALVVFQSWHEKAQFSAARWMEACVLGLVFLLVAALSLSGYLAFAYIIMPPLLWAAVRFEFKGAAVALTFLALITAAFTISGASQFAGDPESQKERQVMLQLFLAISAFSALIVAGMSRQRQQALLTLRQSVEALRERERELSQLVNMVPVQIRRLTPQGEPTFFNQRLLDFFGLHDVGELDKPGMSRLAAGIMTLVHPDDAPSLLETVRRSLATGEPFAMKYRMRRADGAYRWVDGRGEPLRDQSGAIVHWYAISIDIDDEVRAQEAVRGQEREFSLIVDMVPSLIWRLTSDGVPIFLNRRAINYFGLNVGDVDKPGESRLKALLGTIVHPDDAAEMTETLSRCVATGESFSMSYRLRRADGVYRWMSARAEPLRDEAGAILQWYGVTHDIDDEVRAQEELRERETQLRLITDAVPVLISYIDAEQRYRFNNRAYEEWFEHRREEISGRTLREVLGEAAHERLLPHISAALAGEHVRFESQVPYRTGGTRWIEAEYVPRHAENGGIEGFYALVYDSTERKRAEEALRRASDKLAQATQAASLAELSASIAHEVNQPLAAIVANSHACHRWLSAEPPNIERAKITVERISRDANSAADVVSRIRSLFRQATHTRSSEDVNRLINEVCRLMADEIAGKNISIQANLEPDLPPIALDRVQVQQVFVNLIRNGIEAMDAVVDSARTLQIRSCRDGLDAIRVEVRDEGTGFKDAERVFEPFFTTKQNGMGMGLIICRSIIESHGGGMSTANNETCGATVAFTLPLMASEAP